MALTFQLDNTNIGNYKFYYHIYDYAIPSNPNTPNVINWKLETPALKVMHNTVVQKKFNMVNANVVNIWDLLLRT